MCLGERVVCSFDGVVDCGWRAASPTPLRGHHLAAVTRDRSLSTAAGAAKGATLGAGGGAALRYTLFDNEKSFGHDSFSKP